MAEAILTVEHLSKSFGGVQAVNDLSFAVQPGTITSLIGGNGAGKTTAFNLITGNLAPDAGHILYRNTRIDGMAPHRVAQTGIARGFQELRLFNRLTALDNVQVALPRQPGETVWSALLGGRSLSEATARGAARGRKILEKMTLTQHADALAERLSYGQQKLLGLGRLLAAESKLLLLDEPTAGLSPAMVDEFCARMQGLVATGRTILLIEHNVEIVMRLSDWIVVMHEGAKIAEGRPEEVRRNVAVMHTYLGIA
jgi:ABC-type branched-subunit amino acid transport system ATPase component